MAQLSQPNLVNGCVGWLRRVKNLPLLSYRALRWRTGHWLGDYLLYHRPFDPRAMPLGAPIDVMVLIVDHFEPAEDATLEAATESVRTWCERYGRIAAPYRDADGRHPQHGWFYPAENPNFGAMQVLSDYTFRGFGEVEFHLHHGFDTHESFAGKLRSGLAWFNQSGAMLTAESHPQQRFGYIAGNWALDNGAGDDSTSGCTTELLALRDAGCYADFTFPALGSPAQPRKTNAIYYATDTPAPKSYDSGVDVRMGQPASGDLMIVEGPLVLDWHSGKVEDGALEFEAIPTPSRLQAWQRANVHVQDRPEWLFVKLHTHGMQTRDMFLGPQLEGMFVMMCALWNQAPFRLHFVTAREAYNIIKAAEAGKSGNPNDYRDYLIPRPANRRVRCSQPWKLLHYSPERVCLEVQASGSTTIDFAEGPLHSVRGRIKRLEARLEGQTVADLKIEGEGEFEIEATPASPGSEVSHLVPSMARL